MRLAYLCPGWYLPATWPAELAFDANGNFLSANDEWFDLAGSDPSGAWYNAFIHGDALIAKAVIVASATGVHMAPVRLRLAHRQGSAECLVETPANDNEPIRALFRLLGEQANDHYLHDLLESTVDGIASVERDRDGVFRVVAVNGRFAELMSMPKHELLGSTFDQFLRSDAEIILGAFLEAEMRNAPAYRERYRTRAGQRRRIQATFAPATEREGGGRHLTAVLRDVTTVEDDRVRADAVRHQQSLDIMAGGIAHELNNALVAILGNLDLALSEPDRAAGVIDYLLEARASGMRAAELGKMLVASTGNGQLSLNLVAVEEVIASRWSTFEGIAGEHIEVRHLASRDLPPALADGAQLAHCLVALVTNACESISSTGVVELETSLVSIDGAEAGRLSVAAGEYVAVSVRDTGPGISANDIDRVFEPFYSTRFLGRGMGLPSVRGILRAHGGTVTLESELGVGTVATLYLRAGIHPGS